MLRKMDPYVHIKFGSEEFTTKECDGGGKKPTWNEKFNIKITEVSKYALTSYRVLVAL